METNQHNGQREAASLTAFDGVSFTGRGVKEPNKPPPTLASRRAFVVVSSLRYDYWLGLYRLVSLKGNG